MRAIKQKQLRLKAIKANPDQGMAEVDVPFPVVWGPGMSFPFPRINWVWLKNLAGGDKK